MYSAVLFDLFGTLIDAPPMTAYRQMVADVAAALKQPFESFYTEWMSINDGRLDGSFGSSEGDIMAAAKLIGVGVSESQMARCMDIRRSVTREFLVPKRGAVEMLDELRGMDCVLGLVTDCVYDVPAIWPKTQFAPYFSAMHFSCVEKIRKPDRQAYLGVTKKLEVRPEESLFVGDGGSDELNGAVRAGLSALKIDDLTEPDADLLTNSSETGVLRVGVVDWEGPVVKSMNAITEYVRDGG